jgi:hypothetical protein
MKSNIFIKRILILISIVVALFLILLLFPNSNKRMVHINDASVKVEIVDKQESRVLGLSGRAELKKDTGMLFIFDRENFHGIWMKDMNFHIDILWINESYKIVGIKKDAKPDTFPETFYPKTISKYVLELSSGFIDAQICALSTVFLKIFRYNTMTTLIN